MQATNGHSIGEPVAHTFLPAAIGAWCTYIVIDFLIHAVLLARYWRATESYWLPPRELFRMIPLGYLSFGIYCAVATWLLMRLYGNQPNISSGLRFGASAGLFFGVVSALGNYSVFRMPSSALIVWPASLTVESAGAGAAAAWVMAAHRPWRRLGLLFAIGALLLVLGVVVQNVIPSSSQ